MASVSSIGIVLLGSLPMAELVRRLLVRPFAWLGERLGLKPQSLTGMLVGLVSAAEGGDLKRGLFSATLYPALLLAGLLAGRGALRRQRAVRKTHVD